MTLMCLGIRGATTTAANTAEAILEATTDLLQKMAEANNIDPTLIAAAIFTTTRDLNAEFPALAARRMGWADVALMCGHEMDVPDGQPRCIRVLLLVNTEKGQKELKHIYLREAKELRKRGMS
jgi:chorismate mutase